MLQVTLSSCGNIQLVMLQDVCPYDMFRLMLARHGCRTMLRDEAAKDPRKLSVFREELQDERLLINHHIYIYIFL